ncbi:hypothetical protein INT46_002772 [Mucor plumbeus]|uniref:Uncharacterized protein n=1 Tax=Mucor plumbeus TaxID=97098 RepID=A0A8H7QHB7_9FUNG|nr:hypothetical protein INT46_002772 [Mucor plumbeus]
MTEGIEVDKVAVEFGDIEMLRRNEYLVEDISQSAEDEKMEEIVLELEEMTITKTKTYKKYGPEQIACYIHILQETGATIPKAAEACGIPTSSAHKILNQFNDSNGTILPGSTSTQKGKAKPKKLFPVHTVFLIQLFDANPSTVLEQAREELMK